MKIIINILYPDLMEIANIEAEDNDTIIKMVNSIVNPNNDPDILDRVEKGINTFHNPSPFNEPETIEFEINHYLIYPDNE